MKVLRCLIITFFLGQNLLVCAQLDFDEGEYKNDRVGFEKKVYASWNYYLRNNIDSMLVIANRLNSINDNKYISALRYTYLGSFYCRSGKIDMGIDFLFRARELSEKIGSNQLASDVSNELGNAFFLLGDLSKASEEYIESLRFGIRSNDYTAEFNGILGLGKSICANGDTLLGVELISDFLYKSTYNHKYESAADACAFLGMIFSELGDKQVAKMYYKQSIDYAKKSKSRTHLANALTNQAIVDVGNGEMKLAESNFLLAAEHREELGVKKTIVDAYFNLGSFYIMTERFDKAKDYLLRASNLAKGSGMIRDEYDAIEVLLLALPESVLAKNRDELNSRFELLKGMLAQKKEISFEVRGLSSQIAKTGSVKFLNVQKIDRVFWLWFGFFAVLTTCSVVLYLNRPKRIGQFNL